MIALISYFSSTIRYTNTLIIQKKLDTINPRGRKESNFNSIIVLYTIIHEWIRGTTREKKDYTKKNKKEIQFSHKFLLLKEIDIIRHYRFTNTRGIRGPCKYGILV